MPQFYAEFTVVQRHILQFEAPDHAEAIKVVREGRPDDVQGLLVLDTARPVVVVEDFYEDEDLPVMIQNPFSGDEMKWAHTIADVFPAVTERNIDARRRRAEAR